MKIIEITVCTAFLVGVSACETTPSGPVESALCRQILPIMAAHSERVPFASLSEETAGGSSIGYREAPSALNITRNCMAYVAYSPEGVVGGGKYNFFECPVDQSGRLDREAGERNTTTETQAALANELSTCRMFDDWTRTDDKPNSRQYETVFADPDSDLEVVSQRYFYGRSADRASYTTKLIIRVPAPTPG